MKTLQQIDVTALTIPDVNLDELKAKISTGKAIAFTGAGFSVGTYNILDSEPPLAKALAKKISSLGQLGDSDDLMFASNAYLKFRPHDELLDLLKDNYTLKSVSDSHKSICNINWKRFYTTNYDNSIEQASLFVGKRIESVDLTSLPADYIRTPNVCVHINGKIDNAIPDDLTSKIKLSTSSYLSPDSFLNSSWYYTFKRDLETASAIIFMGYSMYDIDIQKILFDNPDFINKTYFIVRNDATFYDTFSLQDFGHILPIGIDGFANLVDNIEPHMENDELYTEALIKINDEYQEEYNSDYSIQDKDIENFLLYGQYDINKLFYSTSKSDSSYLSIKRNEISKVLDAIKNGSNVLLQSALGNGKSVFIKTLCYYLPLNGFDTYILENDDGNYIDDFDKIIKYNKKSVIIIDDFSKYSDILKHYSETIPDNINLIISDRNLSILDNFKQLNFYEISLDILNEDDIKQLILLIDNLALWGEFSGLSPDRKEDKIKSVYNSQLSQVLLALLNSPNIKQKIKQTTDDLYINGNHKDSIFAICLCDTLGVKFDLSLVSEVAGNNEIYERGLRNKDSFKTLFKLEHNYISTKSSIFSLSLINNTFSHLYTSNKLLDIVKRFNETKFDDRNIEKIFKSLLTFHHVERLIPQQKSLLNNYYMKLKTICPWLLDSPHYWVQYAMCRLAFNDYNKAQDYLTNAYEKAQRKHLDYHTENIDTQQARLFLIQSLDNNSSLESFKFFEKAHKLLISLSNDGYKFRQVLLYSEIYSKKYNNYTKGQRVIFEQGCRALLQQTDTTNLDSRTIHQINKMKFIQAANNELSEILAKILASRN